VRDWAAARRRKCSWSVPGERGSPLSLSIVPARSVNPSRRRGPPKMLCILAPPRPAPRRLRRP
jgi:hypothetical protein